MKNHFLLYEQSPTFVEVLKEDNKLSKDKKDYFIEGIYLLAKERNQNGRIYPFSILTREVNAFQENLKNKFRCSGELDHPEYVEIRMANAAHYIIKLEQEKGNEKYFYGKSKILDPDAFHGAKKVIAFIDEGVKFGVSSRGVGDLDGNGIITDYQLITVDIVADPSAAPALVEAVYENRNKFLKKGVIDLTSYENINKIGIDNKHYHNIMENVDQWFKQILRG